MLYVIVALLWNHKDLNSKILVLLDLMTLTIRAYIYQGSNRGGGGPGGEVVRGGGLGGALATHSESIFIFESFLTVELVFITCCWMFI